MMRKARDIIHLNPLNNPTVKGYLWFKTLGNRGSERFSNLPKVTQLVNAQDGM